MKRRAALLRGSFDRWRQWRTSIHCTAWTSGRGPSPPHKGSTPGAAPPAALPNHAEDLGRSYVGMPRTSSRFENARRLPQELVQSIERGDPVIAGTKGFTRKGGGSLRSRHRPIRHLSPRHALHAPTSAYISPLQPFMFIAAEGDLPALARWTPSDISSDRPAGPLLPSAKRFQNVLLAVHCSTPSSALSTPRRPAADV